MQEFIKRLQDYLYKVVTYILILGSGYAVIITFTLLVYAIPKALNEMYEDKGFFYSYMAGCACLLIWFVLKKLGMLNKK